MGIEHVLYGPALDRFDPGNVYVWFRDRGTGMDDSEGCEYGRMRALAIREAQEGMEDGVSPREGRSSVVLA
jgi:hypothetical protein